MTSKLHHPLHCPTTAIISHSSPANPCILMVKSPTLEEQLEKLSHTAVHCRVTELEAQRIEETKEDRDAFRKMLREEIERQAREKNIEIKLPPDKPE